MPTYELLERIIKSKKEKGSLTEVFIADTKKKMDVFMVKDRITIDEYSLLTSMLENL